MLIISLEYTTHIVYNLFNVFSNHTMFKLQRTRIQKHAIVVYISDAPVTMKQSQGNQTKNDKADPKQCYIHANSERSCLNDVRKKS